MTTPADLRTLEILEACETLGMTSEDFNLNVETGCLSSYLADQIMERFDKSDTLPTDIQKAFAVLFRYSRTIKEPINF